MYRHLKEQKLALFFYLIGNKRNFRNELVDFKVTRPDEP